MRPCCPMLLSSCSSFLRAVFQVCKPAAIRLGMGEGRNYLSSLKHCVSKRIILVCTFSKTAGRVGLVCLFLCQSVSLFLSVSPSPFSTSPSLLNFLKVLDLVREGRSGEAAEDVTDCRTLRPKEASAEAKESTL